MSEQQGSNFWRLLELLACQRRLIFSILIIAIIGSVTISLVLPKWYEAEALLLPPRDSSPPRITGDMVEVVSLVGGVQLPIMVTPSDVYARMLKSRTIVDRIIESYDLKANYKTSNMIETRKALLKHAKFRVTEEGLLSIRVEDKDPSVAASMANRFVEELDSLSYRIVLREARKSREFIEGRLMIVRAELDSVRKELVLFQSEHHALDFDEQTKMAMEQATSLKVDLARINISLELRSKLLKSSSSELKALYDRRNAIMEQLDQLQYGGTDTSFFSLPLQAMPRIRGEYQSLRSAVSVGESVHKTLLELLEQAKIREQSIKAPLSILDYADVPEIRSRPQRTLIVLGTSAISFIFAILLAASIEYVKQLKTVRPDDYRRAMRFLDSFFGWLPGVRVPTVKNQESRDA